MDKLGLNLGFFLFQVFNFTIMVILLYAWAYKPIVKMLEGRKNKIAQGLEDARIAADARANAEQEANKILAEAQLKATQVIREATERAEAIGIEIKADAEKLVEKERSDALVEIQQERERILSDLRGQVANLAVAVAQKLIGETLDEKRQHALIDNFFSGIKSGRVTVLEGVTLSGVSAEVTSALPLTPAEKETIQKEILSKAGSQVIVSFRVDPSILGGLIMRLGDKVVNASVVGQLEHLRQNLV
jgi:F-type H+-transporting ATPase subunit b